MLFICSERERGISDVYEEIGGHRSVLVTLRPEGSLTEIFTNKHKSNFCKLTTIHMNITLDELGLSFEDIMQNNLSKIDTKYPKEDTELGFLVKGEE